MIDAIKKIIEVKSKILVVLSQKGMKSLRFYKNIKDVEVVSFESLNPFLVMRKSLILIEGSVFQSKVEKKITKEVEKVKKVVKK